MSEFGGIMDRSLPALALKRPITAIMLTVAMVCLGGVVWYLMPVEFIMKMDIPSIRCWIPYPGATPEQVETEVAIPAEGEFRTLSRLKSVTSRSDSGGCYVALLFDWDTDMGLASSEVRDRIERLKLRLPRDVDRVFLRRWSSDMLPIMNFALFSEQNVDDLAFRAQKELQPRLMRVNGVANVEVSGSGTGDIYIEFDQNALRSRNLSLYEVMVTLQKNNVDLSAGELSDGDRQYLVRTSGEYRSVEDIGNTVVGPRTLRLKEVAGVRYQPPGGVSGNTIDGKRGVFVTVYKESEANTVGTCKAVREEIARAQNDLDLGSIELFTFWDQSQNILSAFNDLMKAGKIGAVLALAVLYLFLMRIRPTLIVGASIPISFVAAFVFMYFWGMSLNLVTLSAMIITVGMLVDDSIVVMENIDRYTLLGLDPVESAWRGATEVGLAITASTATTLVVFVPIFYMEKGEMSIYMREFSIPVTVSLVASFVVAMTLIPLAASRLGRRRVPGAEDVEGAGRPHRGRLGRSWTGIRALAGKARPIRRVMSGYRHSLAWAMEWRLVVVLVAGFLCVVTFLIPYRLVGMQRLPSIDTRQVEIRVQFDQGYDGEMADQVFRFIESVVNGSREDLGIRNVFVGPGSESGTVRAYLLQLEDCMPGQELPYSTQEVRDILRRQLPNRLPGGQLRFKVAEASELRSHTVSLRMRGENIEQLKGYAERFATLLGTLPDVADTETEMEHAKEEIQLRVDETLAGQAGISPMVVARTVDFALRGARLAYLKQEGREVPITASFRREDQKNIGNLDNVAVLGTTGVLVPLSRLVVKEKAQTAPCINRVNGKNVVVVSARSLSKDLGKVKRDVAALVGAFEMPTGYDIQMGEELVELDVNMRSFSMALVLSVILIYMVMGALFESYLLPLSILTSVPLAFIGIYWTMFLTSTPMDSVALIGSILMCGVVVKNGIVIVDHINQLRVQGLSRFDAILAGGHDRFRPVMMTALTTILGCVPLAVEGMQIGEVAFNSLGRALIGGLTTGTLLTLYVVPVFYSLIDDLHAWVLRYLAELKGLGTRARGKQGLA